MAKGPREQPGPGPEPRWLVTVITIAIKPQQWHHQCKAGLPTRPWSPSLRHLHKWERSILSAKRTTAGVQATNCVSKLLQNKKVHMDMAVKICELSQDSGAQASNFETDSTWRRNTRRLRNQN